MTQSKTWYLFRCKIYRANRTGFLSNLKVIVSDLCQKQSLKKTQCLKRRPEPGAEMPLGRSLSLWGCHSIRADPKVGLLPE